MKKLLSLALALALLLSLVGCMEKVDPLHPEESTAAVERHSRAA